jgi:hypothetical protein
LCNNSTIGRCYALLTIRCYTKKKLKLYYSSVWILKTTKKEDMKLCPFLCICEFNMHRQPIWFWLSSFKLFRFCLYQKPLIDLDFKSFDYERTWWNIILEIYRYNSKKTVWTISFLCKYFSIYKNYFQLFHCLMSNIKMSLITLLPHKYSLNSFCLYQKPLIDLDFKSFDYERTWWNIIQKHVVCTNIIYTTSFFFIFTPGFWKWIEQWLHNGITSYCQKCIAPPDCTVIAQ